MTKTRTPTLAVYGATSYTATNHLIPYLASHPDASRFHLILAARNRDKLASVDAAIGPAAVGSRELVELKLDDEGGVGKLCARADVILNLAGPYQLHNAIALITACIKHGTHYLDLCGEPNFLARVIPNYDFAASRTGAVLIPMCGFEAAPGDLNIYHSLHALQAHAGRNVGLAAATNYYDIDGSVSGGTVASLGATVNAVDAGVGGEWSLLPYSWSGPKRNEFKLVCHAPAKVAGAPTVGGWYPFAPLNLSAIRRSWFLSRLSPVVLNEIPATAEAEAAREPRHSESVEFGEAFTHIGALHATNTIFAYLYSAAILLFLGVYTKLGFVRDALAAWIPQPGEGPSKEECERGHTGITTVGRSDDGKYAVVTKYSADGDPGYYHTGRLMAEAGLSLILPPPEGTQLPPLASTGGFLTPSTGLGMVLVERMRINGVAKITSEVTPLSTESKKTA